MSFPCSIKGEEHTAPQRTDHFRNSLPLQLMLFAQNPSKREKRVFFCLLCCEELAQSKRWYKSGELTKENCNLATH